MIHSVKNNNYQRILPIKRHITIDVLLVYMSSLSTNSANEVERVYTTFRCQHLVLSRKRPHLLKNKLKHYYAITVSKFYWCLDSLTLSHILGSMTPEFFVLELDDLELQALQVIKKNTKMERTTHVSVSVTLREKRRRKTQNPRQKQPMPTQAAPTSQRGKDPPQHVLPPVHAALCTKWTSRATATTRARATSTGAPPANVR